MNEQTGRELRTLEDITELTDGRDRAIGLWLEAYDQFHERTILAGKICIGGNLSLPVPRGHNWEDGELTRAFTHFGEVEIRDRETGRYEKGTARAEFARQVTTEIDRRCWKNLLDNLGFDALLDRQAREEFHESLRENPPAFNVENASATFGDIWNNQRDYFLRGIVNTFTALDRRFRSHDGFKIGARLIINNAVNRDGWWHNHNRRDTLHDVEKTFRQLEGKPPFENDSVPGYERRKHGPPDMRNWGIVRRISFALVNGYPTPFVIRNDYFRVRVFKNGNLHIWFENDDLLREINKLLAEYYGEVIGDGYNETEAHETPGYHIEPAKRFGAFMSSPAVAERVVDMANCGRDQRILEPSAGTGEIAKVARARGAQVTCVEIQPGLAHELINAGFDTACANFLELEPGDLGRFDMVIMNPPFDRGRDCDHVRHAWQFVKPGGKLVAIMSARAEYGEDNRHKALHRIVEEAEFTDWGRRKWIDMEPGSFAHAGTNVNTVILQIRKPA